MKTEPSQAYTYQYNEADRPKPPIKSTRIMVVGATGLFGELLSKRLSQSREYIDLTLAARSTVPLMRLQSKLEQLKKNSVNIRIKSLDISTPDNHLENLLHQTDIVINASGPFQYAEQNYHLMRLCATNGVHYIDLADDPAFIFNIPKDIEALALNNNISITSGVSSVPALSSSVFRHYKNDFTTISEIDIGITPGNKTRRGLATVRSILSYAGQPIRQKRKSVWKNMRGWGNLRKYAYEGLKTKRYLSNCLSPDNELFHKYYPNIPTIKFQAGLELPVLHLGLSFASKIAQVFKFNLERLSPALLQLSNCFLWLGSDSGAMHVDIQGHDHNTLAMSRKIEIVAHNGSGPYIPTLAAIILVDKIMKKDFKPGVQTGFELLDLTEFEAEVKKEPALPISFIKSRHPLT